MTDIDRILQLIGIVISISSLLANTLPSEWPATRFLARLSVDLRGLLRDGNSL